MRYRLQAMALVPVLILLSACSALGVSHVASASVHNRCPNKLCPPVSRQADSMLGLGANDVALFVEPDDGPGEVVKAIDNSQNTIVLSAYILSDHRIVRALERAAAQGVDVYVLLDHYPFGIVQQPETMFSLLRAAGVRVRWAPSYFQYSHAKFMVLDDEVLIVSSANFSQSGFLSDRDFVVVDDNPLDVREADNIFRADWDGIAPVLNDPDLLVSPVNSREKFSQLLASARHSIDLYSEEVLDRGIVKRLIQAARRGVRVRILTATISTWARRVLTRAGIHVGSKSSAGTLYIHAKAVMVDNRRAFVGSENFSATSLGQNRELGVMIQSLAAVNRLEGTFGRDWRPMTHT